MTDLHTRLAIALPGDFRHVDVLRFYARDREQVSERTQDQRIEKALHWQGQPALLQLVKCHRGAGVEGGLIKLRGMPRHGAVLRKYHAPGERRRSSVTTAGHETTQPSYGD